MRNALRYIHSEWFKTPGQLVSYLEWLDKNDDAYLDYHQWRTLLLPEVRDYKFTIKLRLFSVWGGELRAFNLQSGRRWAWLLYALPENSRIAIRKTSSILQIGNFFLFFLRQLLFPGDYLHFLSRQKFHLSTD